MALLLRAGARDRTRHCAGPPRGCGETVRSRWGYCKSPAGARRPRAGASSAKVTPRSTPTSEVPMATSTKTQTKVRTFLRAITSEHYGLKEFRRAQLAAPRVRGDDVVTDDASVGHSEKSKTSRGWWRLGPGDEQFLTQTLQVHFVEIAAGGANKGHGHQNEAVFYILQGSGYEIHDDQRYDWNKDDAVVVHTDSMHQHHNDGVVLVPVVTLVVVDLIAGALQDVEHRLVLVPVALVGAPGGDLDEVHLQRLGQKLLIARTQPPPSARG